MVFLVKLLGLLIVILGVAYLYNPKILKPYLDFWKAPKRIYLGAVMAFVIGIIFLYAAPLCRVSWPIVLFGLLGLIKGVLLLVLRKEKWFELLDWWEKRSAHFLRIHSLIAVSIGALLIFSA